MKNKIIGIFVLVLILCAAVFFSEKGDLFSASKTTQPSVVSQSESSSDKQGSLYGPYKVVRVVDGDTIIVDIAGEDTRVRLIGIDTPESVHPDASKNTAAGKTASEHTKQLLTGKDVYLEYDNEKYDKYDRVLAYVYLDGEMINAQLLEDGYAVTMTIPPNTKYADLFEMLEQNAA